MSNEVLNRLDEVEDAVRGPGRLLREARKAKQMDQIEVSRFLNLDLTIISGLEQDDYDNLPPSTFTRGYIRSYSRYLELDPEHILREYDRVSNDQPSSLRTELMQNSQAQSGDLWVRLGILGVVVLLVALAVLWWLNREASDIHRASGDVASSETTGLSAGTGDASGAGAEIVIADADTQQLSSGVNGHSMPPGNPAQGETSLAVDKPAADSHNVSGADTRATAESETASHSGLESLSMLTPSDSSTTRIVSGDVATGENESTQAAALHDGTSTVNEGDMALDVAVVSDTGSSARGASGDEANHAAIQSTSAALTDSIADSAPTPESDAGATEMGVADGSDLLSMQFSEACWTSVRDRNGRLLVYRTVKAGTRLRVRGDGPFQVHLGNAPAVKLLVNGTAFDFSDRISGRIARFGTR